jgi:amino acid permease
MSTSNNEDKVVPKEPYTTAMTEKAPSDDVSNGNVVDVTAGSQALHRKLKGPEVQLFAIGGAIGTCKSLYTISFIHPSSTSQFKPTILFTNC